MTTDPTADQTADEMTNRDLARHLVRLAGSRASGGPGDADYDPELLDALTEAAHRLTEGVSRDD